MFKYHSDMGQCFSLVVVSKKSKKKKFLLFFIGKIRHGIGKNVGFFIGNGAEIRSLEMGRKGPVILGSI